MNIKPSNHTGNSVHQTVTEFIKLKTPEQTIQIGFTDQKVSGRAGLLTFAGFLHWHKFTQLLVQVLPGEKTKGIALADLALGFLAGILAGAQKLAQVAHLRSDVMLPALLAIQRIGSQSSFTRFFQRFDTPGKNPASGLDGPSHRRDVAIPAVHDRRHSQREGRDDDHSVGGAN
ncbi:MAG: hypothetical protein FJ403_23000 [Verrucomicrobia bacterium]|nr:hypothetical protein [Verrucomicrobiota bacterium]